MASSEILEQINHLQTKQLFLEQELHGHKEAIMMLKARVSLDLYTEKVTEKKPIQKETRPLPKEKSPLPPKVNVAPKVEKPLAPKAPKKDLRTRELDFGKVWFVRLGIISLITGLVFLSNFAYQNYIYNWGPAPRLIGLYLLSVLMLGVGTYFEKAKAALSNYGRVLAAGGIAILYYASYAAHHIERLRVIDSSLIGGILLLASAGMCLWYALWKKSTTTALCSIVLAFYSTSINPVGAFTLISGLILTLTGVTLLDRLRQASIGFTTMLGAYLSFIYWQLLVNQGTGYAHASWFVLGYWILCTAVILKQRGLSKPFFSETQLLTYTSLNNSLFIFLTSINFATLNFYTSVWLNIATIGGVFILISLYLQQRKENTSLPASLANLYLGKGFALIALALCIKLSGSSLAISLTIQASLALIAGTLSGRKLLLTAGYLALMLGFGIYLFYLHEANAIRHSIMLILYLALATFLHLKPQRELQEFNVLASLASLFAITALGCLIITASTAVFTKIILLLTIFILIRSVKGTPFYRYAPTPFYHLSHLLALAGILLTLRSTIFELSLGQISIITALLFAAAAVQAVVKLRWDDAKDGAHFNGFYNLVATLMLIVTLTINDEINSMILITSLIPISYHLLYDKVRLISIPVIGFLCYLLAWAMTLWGYSSYADQPSQITQLCASLIPLVHVYLIKFSKLPALESREEFSLQSIISALLTAASAILITIWQYHFIPFWELSLALTATVFYWIDDKKLLHSPSLSALVMYLLALTSVLLMPQDSYTLRYAVILIPFIAYDRNLLQANRPQRAEINRSIAIGFSLALWFIASQHTISLFGASSLSICWALIGLAILCLGFIAKDIVFRTMAFIILGATILHVYGVDVWRLGALLRIISFITLGIVLLIVGYLYCRKVDDHNETKAIEEE